MALVRIIRGGSDRPLNKQIEENKEDRNGPVCARLTFLQNQTHLTVSALKERTIKTIVSDDPNTSRVHLELDTEKRNKRYTCTHLLKLNYIEHEVIYIDSI